MSKDRSVFPWPQPISHYDSDGPRNEAVEFEVEGVKMRVDFGEGLLAPDTLRDRYRVLCLTCDEVIHRATTSATIRCEDHLKDSHGIVVEQP